MQGQLRNLFLTVLKYACPCCSSPQIILDQTEHPELSDYIRIVVFNTSDPNAKSEVGDMSALRRSVSAQKGMCSMHACCL